MIIIIIIIIIIVIPADHREKIKESEKINKYLELAREFKNYGMRKWRWYQL